MLKPTSNTQMGPGAISWRVHCISVHTRDAQIPEPTLKTQWDPEAVSGSQRGRQCSVFLASVHTQHVRLFELQNSLKRLMESVDSVVFAFQQKKKFWIVLWI